MKLKVQFLIADAGIEVGETRMLPELLALELEGIGFVKVLDRKIKGQEDVQLTIIEL